MDLVSVAQIASAVGTLILAALTFAYVLFTRSMVKELRETRLAQERPQVIVDADYSSNDVINLVVRNIGKGAAKEITFEFSAPMESSWSLEEHSEAVPLNELPYFKKGLDFLAPGAEISTLWDSYIGLFPLLRDRGPEEGITITSKYKSLDGGSYETGWTINPLLLSGTLHTSEKGMKDLVKATERISKDLHKVVSSLNNELKVSTETERRQRREERLRESAEREQGAEG